MNYKILPLMLMFPMVANAAIPYRVEQTTTPIDIEYDGYNDSEALARTRRFYIGAAYNLSFWQNGQDADTFSKMVGKDTSSFEVMVGVRAYDTFRVELNYIHSDARWDNEIGSGPVISSPIKLTGETAMLNAIFDARIDSIYRTFREQILVPYVGFGAGISFNSAEGTDIDNKITPVLAAMAGMGIEFNDRFALDIGYRYFCIFSPQFDVIDKFAAVSHQLRAGVRISF